jgi:hypothetical protein
MSEAHNIGAGALRNWATGELPTVKAPHTHTVRGLPPVKPEFTGCRCRPIESRILAHVMMAIFPMKSFSLKRRCASWISVKS